MLAADRFTKRKPFALSSALFSLYWLTDMYTTTLNRLKAADFYAVGMKSLLLYLDKKAPDNDPLPLTTILDVLGLSDAVWALRTVPEYDKETRQFALECAYLRDPADFVKEVRDAVVMATLWNEGIIKPELREAAFEKAVAAAGDIGKAYYLAHVAHPDAAIAAYYVHIADYEKHFVSAYGKQKEIFRKIFGGK
jgi:hypothetical protein